MQQLQEERAKRQDDIRKKRECLQELMTQNVCFQNLLGRNHARAIEEHRQGPPSPTSQVKEGDDDDDQDSKCEVRTIREEKIPLPFLIVNTDSQSVVQIEMSSKRTDVSFDFSKPFEINEDNEILKRLGMNYTSREHLMRSLPPDLFHYCNGKGMLHGIARY